VNDIENAVVPEALWGVRSELQVVADAGLEPARSPQAMTALIMRRAMDTVFFSMQVR
jgi:hypothetical protein